MTPEQKDWFRFGESPYFAMFRAGLAGIPFNELSAHQGEGHPKLRGGQVQVLRPYQVLRPGAAEQVPI